MDPRLLTLESRKQFARASNATRRYQAEALRTGEAGLKIMYLLQDPGTLYSRLK